MKNGIKKYKFDTSINYEKVKEKCVENFEDLKKDSKSDLFLKTLYHMSLDHYMCYALRVEDKSLHEWYEKLMTKITLINKEKVLECPISTITIPLFEATGKNFDAWLNYIEKEKIESSDFKNLIRDITLQINGAYKDYENEH